MGSYHFLHSASSFTSHQEVGTFTTFTGASDTLQNGPAGTSTSGSADDKRDFKIKRSEKKAATRAVRDMNLEGVLVGKKG